MKWLDSLLNTEPTPITDLDKVKVIPNEFPLVQDLDIKRIYTLINPNFDHGPWICGGSVRKLYQKQKLNGSDIDIWTVDDQQMQDLKLKFDRLAKTGSRLTTDHAITYKIDDCKIQLIKHHFANYQEVIDDFDFTICQITTDGYQFKYNNTTISDINNKRLRLANSIRHDTIASRLLKYVVYGFKPDQQLLDDLLDQQDKIIWKGYAY